MDTSVLDSRLLKEAVKKGFRPPVLFWEFCGLLAGTVGFFLFVKAGMLLTTYTVIPLPFLSAAGLIVLCGGTAAGNSAAVSLLKREESPLTEWSDVLPPDKKLISTLLSSTMFAAVGVLLITACFFLATASKLVGIVLLALLSLPIACLLAVAVVLILQGLFLFPAFAYMSVEEKDVFKRFVTFVNVNRKELLQVEAILLGAAILGGLPAAVVMLPVSALLKMLGTAAGGNLYTGAAGLITGVTTLAPLYSAMLLVPVTFLTAANVLFCESLKTPPEEE